MSKELFVSSTPRQTKVALVENGQLAEVYYERESEYTLAGSIYKGRVTRVLPGMQSAFVNIGLERDAFLYVSDFFEVEDEDEAFEPIPAPARPFEVKPDSRLEPVTIAAPEPEEPQAVQGAGTEQIEQEAAEAPSGETRAQPEPEERSDDYEGPRRWRGRRRRRGRSRGIPETKYDRPERDLGAAGETQYEPIILPGESIAKYRRDRSSSAPPAQRAPATAEGQTPDEAQGQAAPSAGEEFRPEAESQPWGQTRTDDRAGEAPTSPADSTETAFADHAEDECDSHLYGHKRFDSSDDREKEAARQRRRYEQMNVAAIFGGAAAEEAPDVGGGEKEQDKQERAPGPVDESETRREFESPPPAGRSSDAPPFRSAAAPVEYHDAPAGAFEEELMEAEEEEDLPHPAEILYEPDEYEELEEETLEAQAQNGNGEQLTEAVEETDQERELIETYESEEQEEAAEPTVIEGGYSEAEEPEEARAELRGPAGTAAFHRGTAPDYSRHHRGRRGGRRMRSRREVQRQPVAIADVLKEGQEVLVQIAKEPIGKKGARITSHIALPGRFLVYMPTVNHVGVSRKISSEEERQRLKRIVSSEREDGHGGFIVRTAAASISEQDLRVDIRFLKSLWHDIRTRAENSKPPALIYHDLNLVERTLRDLVTADFGTIWVDSEQEYERVLRFVNRFQPSLVRRVKLYTRDTPLFEQFGVEEEINKALKPKVWLKSGGYIVINQTEALVAIDINTGKYVGKTARLEDTIFKTNVEAIREIVRQIRLRDLGGIIVIDFIDMDERRNRQKVMQALEEELQNDRAPSKVLQFNDFGLVAITRKRVKQSLERTLGAPCPYCSGGGYVKSPATVCNEIYTEMKKMRRELKGDLVLRVNPEVAKELKAANGHWLSDMEELTGCNIIVRPDATLHQEQFDL